MKDLTEILKNCPSGMEVDCSIYDNVYFECLFLEDYNFPIQMYTRNTQQYKIPFRLTKEGKCNNTDTSKCVIFPKGKKTWDDFQIPFKDGDILTYMHCGKPTTYVYYANGNFNTSYYVAWGEIPKHLYINFDKERNWALASNQKEVRLATKEETEKLFEELKQKGYTWNSETKTVEEIKKFDITILKPFDRVLVRGCDSYNWACDLFSLYHKEAVSSKFGTISGYWEQCIPYEGNEHLLGTTNPCDDYYKTW